MPYKFNVFTGTLDYYASAASTGGVTGPATSTVDAIARWNNATGSVIADSPGTQVQDSGAIVAQAFVTNQQVTGNVTIPDKNVMITRDVILEGGDIILQGDSEIILI